MEHVCQNPLVCEVCIERANFEREIQAARELHQLQVADSRIGFEATNQYYYVPIDLVEKVLVCESIIDRLSR